MQHTATWKKRSLLHMQKDRQESSCTVLFVCSFSENLLEMMLHMYDIVLDQPAKRKRRRVIDHAQIRLLFLCNPADHPDYAPMSVFCIFCLISCSTLLLRTSIKYCVAASGTTMIPNW